MSVKRWMCGFLLAGFAGCAHSYHPANDPICCQAAQVIDPTPAEQRGDLLLAGPGSRGDVVVATLDKREEQPPTLVDRLKLPAHFPGSKIPDIQLPPPTAPREEIEAAIAKYFPPLSPLPAEPRSVPSPTGAPLTLSDLQRLAVGNSPVVRQAAADVDAARGAMIQVGLYPNPTIGYSGETIGPGGGPLHGGFLNQTIKTPGKLGLAREAGAFDVQLAELKLAQAEADLRTQVRSQYFAVLVARENLKVTRAVSQLTDEIYKVLVLQLKAGIVATYEPMQVRVLALQTRAGLVQAHNRYLAAWKQLASALGLPGMPLTDLAGRPDFAIPRYDYDKLLAHVLSTHTDVRGAEASVGKAQRLLRLARITPYPDIDTSVTVVNDASAPGPPRPVGMFQVGIAVPIFDRNQGGILQAQGQYARAGEEAHRARADLTGRLAEAFERYENNRAIVAMYSKDILPSQVQAFRAVLARHARGGAADKGATSYNDLVISEQNLVAAVTNYMSGLRDLWAAVVDVAGLLQTFDLFQLSGETQAFPMPDLNCLAGLCCCHPCSGVADPQLYRADPYWPPAYMQRLVRTEPPLLPKRAAPSPTVVPFPVVPAPFAPVPFAPVPVGPLPVAPPPTVLVEPMPMLPTVVPLEQTSVPPELPGRLEPVLPPVPERPQLGVSETRPGAADADSQE